MATKIELETFAFRYSGVFDFESLYRTAKAWFPSVNMNVNWEKLYKDKVSAPGGLREIEINLQGYVKLDRYRKWNGNVVFKTWDTKETIVDGKRTFQGRIEVRVGGEILLDYVDMYTKRTQSNFVKFLGRLLYHFTRKDADFVTKKKCEAEMYALQSKLRKILGMPV